MERSGHRAGIGWELRLAQQQSSLECPSLDRRQLGQDLGCDLAEDVRQRQEREPCLCLRGPRRQDPKSPGGRELDPREPQRRLADPGLAGDHGDRRQLFGRVDEIEECGELLLPADEIRNADVHELLSSLPQNGHGRGGLDLAAPVVADLQPDVVDHRPPSGKHFPQGSLRGRVESIRRSTYLLEHDCARAWRRAADPPLRRRGRELRRRAPVRGRVPEAARNARPRRLDRLRLRPPPSVLQLRAARETSTSSTRWTGKRPRRFSSTRCPRSCTSSTISAP